MLTRLTSISVCLIASLAVGASACSGDPSGSGQTGSASSTSGPVDPSLASTSSPVVGSTTGAQEHTGSSTGEPHECGVPEGSPPSLMLEDVDLVPIDIVSVSATLSFSAETGSATGHAVVSFWMGEQEGVPIFDLRQNIIGGVLDGEVLEAERFPAFNPVLDDSARMRAIDRVLAACTLHELELDYEVDMPIASEALFPAFPAGQVLWLTELSDRHAGRFMEQWVPANLPHDEFALQLVIEVDDSDEEYVLLTNGESMSPWIGRWEIEFPADSNSMSPLVVLWPSSRVETSTTTVTLEDTSTVEVEILRDILYDVPIADLEQSVDAALNFAYAELGAPRSDRFALFAYDGSPAMEYDGGAVAGLDDIPHVVFHSWIGRGLRPLRYTDGWLDEAWALLAAESNYAVVPLPDDGAPFLLAPDNPWAFRNSDSVYNVGPRVLGTIGNEIGIDVLREMLRDFYEQKPDHGFATTEELERYLLCTSANAIVRRMFYRYVYGVFGDPPPPPEGYCDE